jgi:hypothetical protein
MSISDERNRIAVIAGSPYLPGFKARVWRFFLGALRLGVALGFAFLILAAGVTVAVFTYESWQERARERELRPLRVMKRWPPVPVLRDGEAEVFTKWNDTDLAVRFLISGVEPETLRGTRDSKFFVTFLDKDAFEIHELAAPVTELTGHQKEGALVKLEWQGRANHIPADDYRQFASVQVRWHGFKRKETAEPQPDASDSSRPRWKSLPNWRKLRRGMRPESVRALLGEPTYIDAGAFTYWIYGGRSRTSPHVEIYEGVVHGWQEP